MPMQIDLPLIWAGIIAIGVIMYVIMDGFDLGIGILFPLAPDDHARDVMMSTVAPIWDGNETWLILIGASLFGAFPSIYAIFLAAFYLPVLLLLFGLIFRGVAFEYRWRTVRGKFLWDWAFAGGSTMAAFAQGVALGALVQGIPVADRAYAGGWWDWLTPFSLLTGVALVVGYALLGATWLVYKAEGEVQREAYRFARITGVGTLLLIGVVSLWTPFLNPLFMERWLGWPQLLYTAPVPLLVAGAAFLLFRGLAEGRELLPFLAALSLFVLSYVGLGISFYPYIVPVSVTIWEAAAPDKSLGFLLVGAAVLVPLILIYTAYAYWVFRGKVNAVGGYH